MARKESLKSRSDESEGHDNVQVGGGGGRSRNVWGKVSIKSLFEVKNVVEENVSK